MGSGVEGGEGGEVRDGAGQVNTLATDGVGMEWAWAVVHARAWAAVLGCSSCRSRNLTLRFKQGLGILVVEGDSPA